MRGKHYEAKKSIMQQQLISASTAHESNMSDEFNSDDEFSDGDGDDEIMDEGLGITQQDLNDLNED